MRSSTRISERVATGNKVQTLKLSFKPGAGSGTEASGARQTSFLGEYDRELDDHPEEPLHFEEQFVLRVPREVAEGKGEGTGTGLRDMVKGKGKGLEGVEFKFLDSRRAAFRFNNTTYSAKLVDLPNIIESQKTFDNRHLFKVADISQMLVVDSTPIREENSITSSPLKIDEYIWPHGITPPMRHVRKRRFRKRLSRRAIEVVEEEVEGLLKKDEEAEESTYDLIDAHPDPEIPDQWYIDYDPDAVWHHHNGSGSEFGGSEMYDDPGSVAASQMEDWGDGEGEYGTEYGDEGGEGEGEEGDEGEEGEEGEGVLDQELAAALMEGMEGSDGSGATDDDEDPLSGSDDDDEDDGNKSEEDDETIERRAKIKQFTSEIRALETAIEKKRAGFVGGNPIMMKRFEETISGLQADVQAKIAARQALLDELGKPDEGVTGAGADARDRDVNRQGGSTATPGAEDAEMDEGEAEGDAEEEEEGATPAAGPAVDRASSAPYSDDDDLFGEDEEDDGDGDGADDGPTGGEGDGGVGAGGAAANQGGEDDMDDEMSRMLAAELEGLDQAALDEVPGTPDVEMGGPIAPSRAQLNANANAKDAAAAAALTEYALGPDVGDPAVDLSAFDFGGSGGADDLSAPDMSAFQNLGLSMSGPTASGFIEGGVGRRRLASGAEASSDDSSDDSDD
ncbi:hypothetical protein IAU60_005559 [Kwoniella sp. DSM 27419]